jgi:hypothetical protein
MIKKLYIKNVFTFKIDRDTALRSRCQICDEQKHRQTDRKTGQIICKDKTNGNNIYSCCCITLFKVPNIMHVHVHTCACLHVRVCV